MANKQRKCIVDGTIYEYCNHCNGSNTSNETWRLIYCSENCMDVSYIWDEYRAGNISIDDAYQLLEDKDVSNVENYRDDIKVVIKDILDSKKKAKKKKEESVKEVVVPKVSEDFVNEFLLDTKDV